MPELVEVSKAVERKSVTSAEVPLQEIPTPDLHIGHNHESIEGGCLPGCQCDAHTANARAEELFAEPADHPPGCSCDVHSANKRAEELFAEPALDHTVHKERAYQTVEKEVSPHEATERADADFSSTKSHSQNHSETKLGGCGPNCSCDVHSANKRAEELFGESEEQVKDESEAKHYHHNADNSGKSAVTPMQAAEQLTPGSVQPQTTREVAIGRAESEQITLVGGSGLVEHSGSEVHFIEKTPPVASDPIKRQPAQVEAVSSVERESTEKIDDTELVGSTVYMFQEMTQPTETLTNIVNSMEPLCETEKVSYTENLVQIASDVFELENQTIADDFAQETDVSVTVHKESELFARLETQFDQGSEQLESVDEHDAATNEMATAEMINLTTLLTTENFSEEPTTEFRFSKAETPEPEVAVHSGDFSEPTLQTLEIIPPLGFTPELVPIVEEAIESSNRSETELAEQMQKTISDITILLDISPNQATTSSENTLKIQNKLAELAGQLGIPKEKLLELLKITNQEQLLELDQQILMGLQKLLSLEYSDEFLQIRSSKVGQSTDLIGKLGQLVLAIFRSKEKKLVAA